MKNICLLLPAGIIYIDALNIKMICSYVPSNNNAGILYHTQVFHPIFGQKLLSMVTDQDHLAGVFHKQSVITGHS